MSQKHVLESMLEAIRFNLKASAQLNNSESLTSAPTTLEYNDITTNYYKQAQSNLEPQALLELLARTRVLFFCALSKEEEAIHAILGNPYVTDHVGALQYSIFNTRIDSLELQITTVTVDKAGPCTAAVVATLALVQCSPKLIIMTGICGGVSSDVTLGDIVISEQVCDFLASKRTDSTMKPSYDPYRLDEEMCSIVKALSKTWTLDGNWPWVKKLRSCGAELNESPRAHVAHFGTSSMVIASKEFLESLLNHDRKLTAIDMEGVSIAMAASFAPTTGCDWLIIKAVSDLADSSKGDEYHPFCCHVSAQFALDTLNTLAAKQLL